MARSWTVLFLSGAAIAAGGYPDETHPRAPDTALEIVFKPWYCAECVREKLLESPEREVRMMRMPVAELAKILELPTNHIVIETPNFKILSTLKRDNVKLTDSVFLRADLERLKRIFPRFTVGLQGASLTAHQRAHLYQIRAERIYCHFSALTGSKSKYLGMKEPYELYLFDDYAEHHALVDRFVGLRNDKSGVNMHMREDPAYLMVSAAESLVPGGDYAFSNHVIHNIAHNLADGYGGYFLETWAWLEEGLAHYYERRETPRRNTFCREEGTGANLFEKEDWESTILNLVNRGKDTPLSSWCEKLRPGELTPVEHGLCWSIMEWMVRTEPVRFAKMIEKAQEYETKPNAETCLQFAFGASPSVLHQRWREWVEREYPKRK
ncbi:MAG: hypothetical protein ACREID_00180 [Planctomycetota bacterium]